MPNILLLIVYVACIWLLVYGIKWCFPGIEPGGQKALTVIAVVGTVLLILWAFGLLPGNLGGATPLRG